MRKLRNLEKRLKRLVGKENYIIILESIGNNEYEWHMLGYDKGCAGTQEEFERFVEALEKKGVNLQVLKIVEV